MLWRAITVYVLAGILLACPLLCLPQAAAEPRSSSLAASPCISDDCCPAPRSDSGKDRPGNSGSGAVGTCLCHGAVLNPHAPLPSPQTELAILVPVDDCFAPAELTSAVGRAAIDRTACHFPWADSGRMLRALIESLLI